MPLPAPITDISRALSSGHPNWPGDAPLSLTPNAVMARGDTVNIATISTSTHTGTHVDAPWHYSDTGARLDAVPLDIYIGSCLLLDARAGGPLLGPELLDGLSDLPERLLLYTGQPDHWDTFPRDFVALSPAFVRAAAAKGVRLVGTDAPSVDPLESKTLDAHAAVLEAGLFILEGLRLGHVPPGRYELVCLPLPLAGADGAPARAVLRALP